MNYVIFIENSKLGRRHFNGALKVYNRWAWPYYGPVELKVGHATVFIPCDTVRVQYLGRDQEYRHRAFGIGSLSDYDFLGANEKNPESPDQSSLVETILRPDLPFLGMPFQCA